MMPEPFPKEVLLTDSRSVTLRPPAHDDFPKLRAFFDTLPDEDRLFVRHDLRDPQMADRWNQDLGRGQILPLAAFDDHRLVGNGSLHIMAHGWLQHMGHLRLVTAPSHRHRGLGRAMTRELVDIAAERDLEKLQAHVMADNSAAVRMLEGLGFRTEAILRGIVKDHRGKKRNLAIMISDVASVSRVLDDWIQDSMVPAYRVPGNGA